MHVARAVIFAAAFLTAAAVSAQTTKAPPTAAIPEGQMHMVAAAKVIVADAEKSKSYFERFFGMQHVADHAVKDAFTESIMSYGDGALFVLFQSFTEAPLKRPAAPVAFVYTPNFEETVKRLEDAKQTVVRLPAGSSGMKIAIAREPGGNAVEIVSRAGKFEVGGSKLIVDDRLKAEEFFGKVFDVKPGQSFVTPTYDEGFMSFGEGPIVALFQPKNEAPLPKSQSPVVAIYTKDFDNVLQRVKDAGYGYRELKTSSPDYRIIVAKDPSGNSIEIIRRAR